jgi:hypothetical protein
MKRLARLWPVLWSLTARVLAQSPFDGTWKIDNNQTQSTAHYDYLLQGGEFRCLTCATQIVVKADGLDHSIAGDPCYDTVSVRVVDERRIEETDKKSGKTVGTLRIAVSDDGKSATENWTESCNAKGDVVSGVDMLVRVAPGPVGAHAISGSWKISKRIGRSENALVITLKLTSSEFSFFDPTDQGYVAKLNGAETPFLGDVAGIVVCVKRIDERTVEQTEKRGGKVVAVTRFVVAADGKTLHVSEQDKTTGTLKQFVAHRQ